MVLLPVDTFLQMVIGRPCIFLLLSRLQDKAISLQEQVCLVLGPVGRNRNYKTRTFCQKDVMYRRWTPKKNRILFSSAEQLKIHRQIFILDKTIFIPSHLHNHPSFIQKIHSLWLHQISRLMLLKKKKRRKLPSLGKERASNQAERLILLSLARWFSIANQTLR